MKAILLSAVTVLLASFAGPPAQAQSGCADVDFDDRITTRFPNARDACLGIETREGEPYAHFQAELVSVSGNNVRAKFRLPDGGYSETFAFEMDPGDRVHIDGRSYRYSELGRGQELDVYLPPDRWEFHIPEEETFEVAEVVMVVVPYEYESYQADAGAGESATLPATAGPLPTLGLAGALLTLVGLTLMAIRRRINR